MVTVRLERTAKMEIYTVEVQLLVSRRYQIQAHSSEEAGAAAANIDFLLTEPVPGRSPLVQHVDVHHVESNVHISGTLSEFIDGAAKLRATRKGD